MNKFKIGDIVKIKTDLQDGMVYENALVEYDMWIMRGNFVTIKKIYKDGTYGIKEDVRFKWDDNMFEQNTYVDLEYKQKTYDYIDTEDDKKEYLICYHNKSKVIVKGKDKLVKRLGKQHENDMPIVYELGKKLDIKIVETVVKNITIDGFTI